MNDGFARAEGAAADACPTHIIGIGPDEEFVIARQLTSGPVTWLGSVENFETFLGRPPLPSPYVVLLDGLPLPQLIATLDQSADRSEEHPSELQSLMRISYAVLCLKNK